MELYLASISKLINDNLNFSYSSNTLNRLKNVKSIKRQNEIKATEILFSKVFEDYDILTIGVSKNGKPFFNEANIKFNYAHSKDNIALLVSDKEVGIDIEEISIKAKKVANKFLNEDEKKFILNDEFYTLFWTIKEASIKKLDLNLSAINDINIVEIFEEENHFISIIKYKDFKFNIVSFKYLNFFISHSGHNVLQIMALN